MLAIATQYDLPDWEVDDLPFHAALDAAGIPWRHAIWNDPVEDWSAYEAVLLRTTWDYAHQRDAFVAWAERAAGQTRLINPADIVRWNTDKRYLRDLEAAGVPIAPTVWLEPGDRPDIATILAERGWSRGFIKPIFGQTARETLRFTTDEAEVAQNHVDRLLTEEGLMLQPYLPSVETQGEYSAICFGGQVSHGVRKVPVPGDYRVQDDFGAHDEPAELDPNAIALVHSALAAIPHEGPLTYARVDMLHTGETWVCNELEIVEPSLFFRHDPASPQRLVEALKTTLG